LYFVFERDARGCCAYRDLQAAQAGGRGMKLDRPPAKDKAYEDHVAEQAKDRPKDFGVDQSRAVDDYVRQWCELNGLRHEQRKRKRRKGRA
jgi:hypothetical protein